MIPPAGPNPNPKLRPLSGPSPLSRELKPEDFNSPPSPEPQATRPWRNTLEGQRPTLASETPSESSWLANRDPAPRQTGPAQMRQSDPQQASLPVATQGRRHTGPTLIEQIDQRKAERAPMPSAPLRGGPTLIEQIDKRQGKSAKEPATQRNDGLSHQGSVPQRHPELPIERHATLLPPPHTGHIPDLDTAIKAMRNADTQLAETKADLARGQRQLRTSQYTLNSYRRNPPELIDAGKLGRMEVDAEAKGTVVWTLQSRVDQASINAENRRRDVRTSLSADA